MLMKKTPTRRSSRVALIESLESRTLLSSAPAIAANDPIERSAIVARAKPPSPGTKTTLSAHAGTLGQAITFTVTVRDAASLGAPTGSVNVVDHGKVIKTLTLAPTTSTDARFDLSSASYTIPAGAGGSAYYFGSHTVSAVYTSAGSLRASRASATFRVAMPKYTVKADGLKVATVTAGSGSAIAAGQTASMLYTGYLFHSGTIFDHSTAHGVSPFRFTVNATPKQVIAGFDEGALGMQVGETRVLVIPSKLGYGTTGSPPSIPANARLVFLITLVGIF